MVGHGGSNDASYLADPTCPIPSHCASIVVTSTLRVNSYLCFQLSVLAAEVCKHYVPKLVELHNYVGAHAVGKKVTNWQLLNR